MKLRSPLLTLLLGAALVAHAAETPSATDTATDATPLARPLPPIAVPSGDEAAGDTVLDEAAFKAPAPPPPPIDLDYRPPAAP